MPLDLAKLQAKAARVSVDFDGETIDVEYRPHRYDNAMQLKLGSLREVPAFDPLIEALADLVCGWDVTDGGKPLPANATTLARFPVMLLLKITGAIMDDVVAKKNAPNSPPIS